MTERQKTLKWIGPEALRMLLVPVGDLTTHPQNPRRGNIDRIADSLSRFGQMRPIPYQESTGYIVAGNHTFRAAVETLGWTHVAAVPAELEDGEALAYVIADNRTADLGEYDDAALAAALNSLMDGGKIAGTGFTAEEIEVELARIRDSMQEPLPPVPDEPDASGLRTLRGADPLVQELILAYDPETYVRFGNFVKILSKEYGTKGIHETVYQAIEREARRVNAE